MSGAVKFLPGTPDVLEIKAIPFYGPIRGRDTDGEFFSPRTDLCLDWFPRERPLLYDHGTDTKIGVNVVGRVDSSTAEKRDDGWWVQAQLDRKGQYFELLKQLIDNEALFGSSGAMPHLTRKSRTGEILRWPWVEQTLTPTPANVFAIVQPNVAQKHFHAIGLELPANFDGGERMGKAGRVLSAENEQRLRAAVTALQAVLDKLGNAGG